MEHESKCKFLHGHRYVLEATFVAKQDNRLDDLGRVIDFGVIQEVLGGWIDSNWDHNTILHQADKALGDVLLNSIDQSAYYLPSNPTAENMAQYLLDEICPKLFAGKDVECQRIRLWETPNCYADAV